MLSSLSTGSPVTPCLHHLFGRRPLGPVRIELITWSRLRVRCQGHAQDQQADASPSGGRPRRYNRVWAVLAAHRKQSVRAVLAARCKHLFNVHESSPSVLISILLRGV